MKRYKRVKRSTNNPELKKTKGQSSRVSLRRPLFLVLLSWNIVTFGRRVIFPTSRFVISIILIKEVIKWIESLRMLALFNASILFQKSSQFKRCFFNAGTIARSLATGRVQFYSFQSFHRIPFHSFHISPNRIPRRSSNIPEEFILHHASQFHSQLNSCSQQIEVFSNPHFTWK